MTELIQLIVAFLGLAAAFETFSKVGLFWKLVAVGVSGCLLLNVAAMYLASWVKPKPRVGFPASSPKRSSGRFIVGSIGLAAITGGAGAAAWGLVYFYGIGVTEIPSSKETLEIRIRGAVPVAARLLVLLPAHGKAKCFPKDPSPDPDRRAEVTILGPESPEPHLELSNFRYPQIVGVVCSPHIGLGNLTLRPEPLDVEVFRPERASLYHTVVIVIGGALWFVGTTLLWFRSR